MDGPTISPKGAWIDAGGCRAWVDALSPEAVGVEAEKLGAVLAAVMRESERPSHVFKNDSRSRVTLIESAGRRWVLKRQMQSGWRGALHRVYRAIGLSPAWREWRGQRRLKSLGMRVAMAAAILVDERGAESLLSPMVEGPTLDRIRPADESPATRYRLAATLGRHAGRLLARGWVNRDHKATNLIIDPACWEGRADPIMLDAMGLRRRRGRDRACRMFAVLLRSTLLYRPVSSREAMVALREAIRADPTLSPVGSRRLRHVESVIRRHMSQF
jgi:hypothetical protein